MNYDLHKAITSSNWSSMTVVLGIDNFSKDELKRLLVNASERIVMLEDKIEEEGKDLNLLNGWIATCPLSQIIKEYNNSNLR